MSYGTLAIIGLVSGLLIGMNPVLISSFTAYVSNMIGRRTSNNRYTAAGLLFIFYYVMFILFFGLGFASFITYLDADTQAGLALAISIITIFIGLSYIRRYFYKEPLIKPPKEVTSALNLKVNKKRGPINIIGLTLIVVYATLPSVGVAIAVISIIGALFGPLSLVWIIPFIVGLVTPIYGILALLSDKTKPSAIIAWKERSKAIMRLYGGLSLIALAWLLLYIISLGGL